MYYTVIKHFRHLRALEKSRKHTPARSSCLLHFARVRGGGGSGGGDADADGDGFGDNDNDINSNSFLLFDMNLNKKLKRPTLLSLEY